MGLDFKLELCEIVKQFPGVRALDHVSMEIRGGETHVLLGENGAGKSSLMKALCGAYRADQERILLNGTPIEVKSPADAARAGISVIFQEFSLVPYLSIAHNLFLGREPGTRVPGIVDECRMRNEARDILRQLKLDIDPDTPVAGGRAA